MLCARRAADGHRCTRASAVYRPGQLVFLPVSGDGAGVSDGLHRLIRAELTHSAPQRLIDVPPQSLGDLQREAGCDALEAGCLGRIARFLGCEVAVLLRVGSSQGGRVVATLELVSAAGEVRGRAERVAAGPRADVALTAAVPGLWRSCLRERRRKPGPTAPPQLPRRRPSQTRRMSPLRWLGRTAPSRRL